MFLIYRIIHVFSGIFWVGTTMFMVAFLEPTIRASGEAGGKLMGRLVSGTRLSLAMGLTGWATAISGLLMYAPLTNFAPSVVFGLRLPLTLGALAGVAAGMVGTLFQGRASGQLTALNKEIAGAGRPPTPDEGQQIGALQAKIYRGSRLSALLMVAAVLGMLL
jgi:hypothetical protein